MRARWIPAAAALLAAMPAAAQDSLAPPASQGPVQVPAPAPVQVPAATRAPPGRVVQGLIERAIDAFSRGAWDEGMTELEDAEAIAPDTAEIWAVRGIAFGQMGRGRDAHAAFDRADAIAPDLPFTIRGRGVLAGSEGRYAEAVTLLERAVKADPADTQARIMLIAALLGAERPEPALALAEDVIAQTPDNIEAWQLRVTALHALDRDAEAAQAGRDMAAAFPDDPAAQAIATSVLEASGQYAEAEAMLAQSLASGETPQNLYESATRRSPSENSIKLRELTRALELDATFTPALYERANTYWADYRLREALADIDRLIELEPLNWGAHQLRGRILMDQNRNADAARIAAQLVADHADAPDALATAMFLYAELNQITRARQVRERLRAIAPDHYAIGFLD